MLRSLDLLCAALGAMMLLGCVPIPIPVLESSPTEKAEKTITVGQTTRADVLSSIGEPPFVRRNGTLFVYNAERLHGSILLLAVTGTYATEVPFYDTELLAITFDDDGVVRGVERAAATQGDRTCLPSGICLGQAGPKEVLLAPSTADAQAKLFAADAEFCTVYLFREDNERQVAPNVTIDGENTGSLPSDAFMRLRVAPGRHEVSVELFASTSQKLECNANQVLFWRARPVVASSARVYESRFYLEPVSPSIGQTGVQRGRLLFGPLD